MGKKRNVFQVHPCPRCFHRAMKTTKAACILIQMNFLYSTITTGAAHFGFHYKRGKGWVIQSGEEHFFSSSWVLCVFHSWWSPKTKWSPKSYELCFLGIFFGVFFYIFFMSSTFFCVLLSKEILVFSMTIIHISSNQTWIWIKLSNISTT